MENITVEAPRFNPNQTVRFIGGEGTIKQCHANAHSWVYTVEMMMGPEPTMGRIGDETSILLLESDLMGFN